MRVVFTRLDFTFMSLRINKGKGRRVMHYSRLIKIDLHSAYILHLYFIFKLDAYKLLLFFSDCDRMPRIDPTG